MVPNPIYAGPVYDIVQPQFDQLAKSPPRQALPTPPSQNGRTVDAAQVAVDKEQEELELNNSLRSKSLSTNFYSSDMVAGSMTRITLTTRTTGIKRNGEERNKLHLTLPTNGGKDHCANGDAEKVEDTYIEMNKTGTIGSVNTQDTLV